MLRSPERNRHSPFPRSLVLSPLSHSPRKSHHSPPQRLAKPGECGSSSSTSPVQGAERPFPGGNAARAPGNAARCRGNEGSLPLDASFPAGNGSIARDGRRSPGSGSLSPWGTLAFAEGMPRYFPFRLTSASDFLRIASNSSPGFQVGICWLLATTRPV